MTDTAVATPKTPDEMTEEARTAYAQRYTAILTGAQAVLANPGASETDKKQAEDIVFLFRAIMLYQGVSESVMGIVEAAAKVNERCDTQNLFDLQIAFNKGQA